MTVRTKAGLQSQVNSLLATNTAGDISAADLRSVLTDFIDSLLAEPTVEEFTPELSTTEDPPTYTLATEAGVWGAPSFAKFSHRGPKSDVDIRIVVDNALDDFDAGSGYFTFPLPFAISSDVDIEPDGHIVQIAGDFSSAIRYPMTMTVDAVYDPEAPVMFYEAADGNFVAGSVLASGTFPATLDGAVIIFVVSGAFWRDV